MFCSITSFGQSYAKEFVNKQNDSITQDVVYLYINPVISYRNESIEKISNFDSLDIDTQNELLMKYAPIQDSIKDSLLLSNYGTKLISTLLSLGLKVIYTSPENFPKRIDANHHTLNIAQLEIEEFTFPDSLVYKGDESIKFHKQLNGIRFNAWLIYNEADTNSRLVFYNEVEIADQFEGEIIKQNNEYTASYDYKKIQTKDAYETSKENGITSAQYFFNFLMNKYVWIRSQGNINYYYSINPQTKELEADTQPFDYFDIVDYK